MGNGCDCKGPCEMPSWVVSGWYANNPDAQARASAHWHHMRRIGWTTAEERAAAQKAKRERSHFRSRLKPCAGGCGLAFFRETTCYWCRQRGYDAIRQAMEAYRVAIRK